MNMTCFQQTVGSLSPCLAVVPECLSFTQSCTNSCSQTSWKQSLKPTLLSAETVEEAASFLQQYNTDPYMVAEILNRLGYPSLIPEELVPRQRDGYCPVSMSSGNMWGDDVEKRWGGGVLFQHSMGQKACFVSRLLWAVFWKDSYPHKRNCGNRKFVFCTLCCALAWPCHPNFSN